MLIHSMQPQRIGRPQRGRTNENAPIEPKVVHQRFKSMGNISTVISSSNGQNNAKRTAFGDLSNIGRSQSRDDSTIGGKKTVIAVDNELIVGKENIPGALSGPAQRLHSTQGVKGSTKTALVATNKQSAADPVVVAPLNPRKQSTRNTLIYKDPEPAIESHPLDTHEEVAEVVAPDATRADQVREENVNEPKVQHDQKQADAEDGKDIVYTKATIGQFEQVYDAEQAEEAAYETWHGLNPSQDTDAAPSTDVAALPTEEKAAEQILAQEEPKQITNESNDTVEDVEADQPAERKLVHISQGTGTEEYWIDEDELYEEEDDLGPFPGDTTNMPTVPLIPKYTAQVYKDLTFAKRVVEDARKVMPADDEHWDVTMVAEYGEEIFDYLRELEVSGI